MHMSSLGAYTSVAKPSTALDVNNIEEVEAWPGPMHRYIDIEAASIRNNHRAGQILCSSVVIDAVQWLSPDTFPSDERWLLARNKVQSAVNDICYSVPFNMWGSSLKALDRPSERAQLGKCTHRLRCNVAKLTITAAADGIGGHFLVWPLSVALNARTVPEIQRRWLKGRLRALSWDVGIGEPSMAER